jgi:hypothetical protein
MEPIIKTKSFWTGAGSIVTGVGLVIIGQKADGLQLIFTGLSVIFLRNAIRKR